LSKIHHEKEIFEKSLERKSNEFIASQQQSRRQLENKTKSALTQLCANQVATFEGASRELSYRQEQVELMVSNISKFRVHFASWAVEKQNLLKQLNNSVQSRNEFVALLQKTEKDLGYSQGQCARLQTSIEEQNALNMELEEERSNLLARISRLEKKASDLEVARHSCIQELDQIKSSKNSQLEQKAQRLKELMQSITLQNDKIHKKQKALEQKESTLAIREEQVRDEAAKNDELYKLVQQQNAALKSLEQDLEIRQNRQLSREQELEQTGERLTDLESILNQKQDEINASKQKVKELALQLQKRNEELNKQKQQLQEKIRSCDEYEATLSAWEQRLDEVANMLQKQEDSSSS
jgi:chromosome segregation ATPase